jgi:hypothetical protein
VGIYGSTIFEPGIVIRDGIPDPLQGRQEVSLLVTIEPLKPGAPFVNVVAVEGSRERLRALSRKPVQESRVE